MTGIPAAIRDAVHLLLWWRFVFVVSFFILFIKGCEENLPETIGFLKDGGVWNLWLCLGDFLRAAVINRNPRPCEIEMLVSLFG